ncbi:MULTISPECIES: sugar ABC transporter substrate-binding protein [Anaerolinea]|uniref:ABC transporter substrate-binding protein n=1 Tax=Anaerolinea TaxID=233189 RepID=UPI0026294A2B|nr:sugar ABC transporter substrate-binding protein [Anaerolinea thermophila]
MKRTLFSLILVLILALTACAQAGGKPAASGGPVEIRFMAWGDPAELEVWKQIVADFEKENANVKVSVEVSDWDSYWTKLKTLLAANTPPDIFAIDAPLYKDYQARGVLLNLKPYLDANPGLLDGLYPVTLKAYETPEGYFGLPRDFQTIVVFYNKDMFDAAGVPYPQQGWTYDDLREIARKLTRDTNGDGKVDQYGFYADLWDMELIWSEGIWAYGGDVINADATRTLIGTPEARKAWKLFHDMIFVDGSWPDANTAAQYGGDPFLAGVAAMTTIGHWAIPGYAEASFKWDVAPMPAGPAGQATSVNSAGFVVAKATKYPQESFNFIKFVLSEKGQTRLAELGFACPVLKSVAESPAFLEQEVKVNHQVFLDSLAFARMKPSFKGYEEWSSVIGDGMSVVWTGEADLDATLDEVVKQADEVLAKNK